MSLTLVCQQDGSTVDWTKEECQESEVLKNMVEDISKECVCTIDVPNCNGKQLDFLTRFLRRYLAYKRENDSLTRNYEQWLEGHDIVHSVDETSSLPLWIAELFASYNDPLVEILRLTKYFDIPKLSAILSDHLAKCIQHIYANSADLEQALDETRKLLQMTNDMEQQENADLLRENACIMFIK